MPEYPLDLRRQGVSGIAVLRLKISASGVVSDITVMRASEPEFAAAAKASVSSWAFEPATRDGKPVMCSMDYTFQFRIILEEEPNAEGRVTR